jgi:ribosomal protein S12 methylthiotransferase
LSLLIKVYFFFKNTLSRLKSFSITYNFWDVIKDLLKEVPEIDAVVNLSGREDIVDIIIDVCKSSKPQKYLNPQEGKIFDDRARLSITPAHWAYLRISEGCDHSCSFCTIPRIRGRFRSKPFEHIIEEAGELASAGVKELNIVAQDTAYYGKDLGLKDGLASLIKELDEIEGIEWIRLMYLYPVGVTDKLLDAVGQSPKVVPYFDIPIQHINDSILEAMRRPESNELIRNLLTKIRERFPNAALRTTVILGFPGETEQQFRELLDFIRQMRFDALGAFTYYREKGTKAYHLPEQVDDAIKQRRYDEVMRVQQEIAFSKNEEKIGNSYKILLESDPNPEGVAAGRYYGQAPEIDSLCYIEDCTARQGEFIQGKVTSFRDYDLIVRENKD